MNADLFITLALPLLTFGGVAGLLMAVRAGERNHLSRYASPTAAPAGTESNPMNPEEKATDVVAELLKLIPATSGVMLALIWGLATPKANHHVLCAIRIASIVLVVSILMSLLGLQFVVARLEGQVGWVSKQGAVQCCFFVAWLTFVGGCACVLWSLFLI